MSNVSFGDVLFILVVFGIIYGCLFLARRGGSSTSKEKNSKPEES